ncbi:MAG: PEP-CTERM sorting domain-containing protein [Phycisphaeraceae bacterium]|nr:PEP-CTERM sorting domain-containing protein [Phycisphaeraceae bacterium]
MTATFVLLDNSNFVGYKPSAPAPAIGDWLVGTGDDQNVGSGYNPNGAFSHNFADFGGAGGAGFNMAPSLSGSLTAQFTEATPGAWNVAVTSLAYSGQATPVMFINQFLVTPGSPATQNAGFNVDGLGNSGNWQGTASGNWAIDYNLDFYFATNADGDVSVDPNDVDATFNDKPQGGYLIPVEALTAATLSGVTLDDPAGFYGGDFEEYLLNLVKPSLPVNATYLLVTQMSKTHPDYAESGLPINTSGLIGNTTIAYTTAVIPEPTSASLMLLAVGVMSGGMSRRRQRK